MTAVPESTCAAAWLAPLSTGEADALGPVHLAYLAAALLLPVRLFVIARAWAQVPSLQAEVRNSLGQDRTTMIGTLRRSNHPYVELARLLLGISQGGQRADVESARTRALEKIRRRTVRSQALDAASLLLLLWLVAGRTFALGPGTEWGIAWIALMLLCTIFARAGLHHRLATAALELERELASHARAEPAASLCAFCDAKVQTVDAVFSLPEGRVEASAAFCSECGKVVATLP